MGCCGSTEAGVEAEDVHISVAEQGGKEYVEARRRSLLNIEEMDALHAKPKSKSFMSSVHKARKEFAWNDSIMLECCTRLQAYNERIKEYIAIYDSATVDEAMNGGFMGLGCNDNKLIAALCMTGCLKFFVLTLKLLHHRFVVFTNLRTQGYLLN